MILYMDNLITRKSKKIHKNLLEQIDEFGKVAGIRSIYKFSCIFILAFKQTKKEIENAITFYSSIKRVKYRKKSHQGSTKLVN